MWNEFSAKRDFGGKDTGIDLVAYTHEGDYWTIQCKCFDKNSTLNKKAKEELIIFSPFISKIAIEDDNVIHLINKTTDRGVKITILTDKHQKNSELGRKLITNTKSNLIVINGINNKTICVDDNLMIEGSFNWLSAVRDSSQSLS